MPEFKLPDLGENIESGDVVAVLVKEGDVIQPQQEVIEIETEKAVIAVPSTAGGKITKIHVGPGQAVKPGQVILTLEAAAASNAKAKAPTAPAKQAAAPAKPAEAPAAKPPAPRPAQPAKAAAPAAPAAAKAPPAKKESPAHPPPKADHNGHGSPAQPALAEDDAVDESDENAPGQVAPAGPAVRRLARELGVNLSRVRGTGPDGRITRDDVINAVRQANAAAGGSAAPAGEVERDSYGNIRREQMSKIRKTIATNMVRSVSTIPHLTNFDDADISELEDLRKDSAASYAESGIKLTSLAFILKAVALSLKQHPTLNASLDMEKGEIVYKHYVNLGVAVDTVRGLIVPVLRDVDRLSIPQIAQGVQALAEKVRAGKQTLDDLRGGTFTISNLGAVGGRYSTPIINHPEVAILLAGRSRKMPVVTKQNTIEPRLIMPLSLSYDHRLVDGAAAARFLSEVIEYLESPGRLLLAP
jgi:pyruvate dehydrogenase E2 component (dihydrolipoamide acetyltransferase)